MKVTFKNKKAVSNIKTEKLGKAKSSYKGITGKAVLLLSAEAGDCVSRLCEIAKDGSVTLLQNDRGMAYKSGAVFNAADSTSEKWSRQTRLETGCYIAWRGESGKCKARFLSLAEFDKLCNKKVTIVDVNGTEHKIRYHGDLNCHYLACIKTFKSGVRWLTQWETRRLANNHAHYGALVKQGW